MRVAAVLTCVLLWAGVCSAQSPVEGGACARLAASLTLPKTTVTSAKAVAAGTFVPPPRPDGAAQAAVAVPAFCRVALTIAPTSDSDIKAEVWLPLSGWNGKFQQVGNGGWGGSIQYGALAAALQRGYAAASTDTGHTGDTARFAIGHPEKLIDFGYRAVHETAVQSKSTIAALYGAAPRLSYFTGCSGGGRQAFMEAQRYPQDFDGIVAGAPGYNRTDQSFQLVTIAQATHKSPESFIPATKYRALHQAAVNACDALDGLKDGLISNPMACRFDPKVVECKGAESASCLTPAQVESARTVYTPVMNPHTGQELFPAPEPGSEMNWGVTSGGARPLGMSDDLFKYVVFQDPNWDFRTLDVARHLELARKIDNGILSPTSPNLKPFADRGGKLIIYHGWGDTNISPRSSVIYHTRLRETLGDRQVDQFVRLYMVPGMAHCGGGEGPNVFDMLTALEQWREQGKPPAEVIASHLTEGHVDRTRPLCPFPQVARYKGTGSSDEAENFACTLP